jgi:hypothetical protein
MSLGGPLYLAAVKLQRMVALSANWQAAIGTADVPTATAAVHLKDVTADVPRPHAIVSPGEKLIYKPIAGGNQIVLSADGSLFLYLAIDVDAVNLADDLQAEYAAISFFGQVCDDVAALSAADDPGSADGTSHLAIVGIAMRGFYSNPEEEWQSLGRFFFAGFDVEWSS